MPSVASFTSASFASASSFPDRVAMETRSDDSPSSSSSSGSNFPTDSEYLDKSLSVWLGESHDESHLSTPVPLELAPLDIWTAASIGHFDFVKSIAENKTPVSSYPSSSSSSSPSSSSSSSSISNDLNARNKGGWTALMYASYIGHDNIVDSLLSRDSIDVNVKSAPCEVTALILAASCGNETISAALLQRGADVNARDKKGWTALFHATNYNHANLVKLLLRNGATLDCSEPKHGYTPFMLAAGEGLEMIITSFLAVDDVAKFTACVNAKNLRGDTARSIAYQRGHTKIVSLVDEFLYRMQNGSPTSQLTGGGECGGNGRGGHNNNNNNNNGGGGAQGKTPSILDGPKAFERLRTKPNAVQKVRDSSPRDSRGADSPDQDADDDPFGNTAAVTIRSSGSGSSSRGLAAALGLTAPTAGGEASPKIGDDKPEAQSVVNDESQWQSDGRKSQQRKQRHHLPQQQQQQQQQPPQPPKPKMDLPTLLTSLGLQKYIAVFDEIEVDLAVFLTLTDNDLRECGITLFGPRRKMTSAIARYHSYASISQSRGGGGGGDAATGKDASSSPNNAGETSWIESLESGNSNPLEKAYADKLEAEMQEMAIRLHQALAKEKESASAAQKTRRQLDALETNFQQIVSFLYDLRKSASHSRKLSGGAAQLAGEVERSVLQHRAPPPPPPRQNGEDNNGAAAAAAWNQRNQLQQRQLPCDRQTMDPASLIPPLVQFHAELESLTTMQSNRIEDLLRKFNRNEGNGNSSA